MVAVMPEEVVSLPQAPTLPQKGPVQSRSSQTVLIACAISVAAGVIHAVAMVDHFDHYWLFGLFFLVVTYFQVLWAIWVHRHPQDKRALKAGAIGSLAIIAVWLTSRTVGVPVGPGAGDPEPFGAMDLVAALDQLVLAALIVVLVKPDGRFGRRVAWIAGAPAMRMGIMLCSASVFSLLVGSHSH